MKRGSLTFEALDGMAWQGAAIAANMILRAGVLILLARTLTPMEFGIIAAATVITSITNQFSQLGISKALVQRHVLTPEHVRTGFAFSVYTGIAATILVFMLADWLAAVFRIPELVPYVQFLSLTLLFASIGAIPAALVQRERRFRIFGLVELSSFVLGFGFVALPLALLGFGAWSLAWAYFTQWATRMIAFHFIARPAPTLLMKAKEARDLLKVGTGFSLGQVGNFVALQVDYFIVGRWLGAEALGFYNRAYQFLMLPAQLFGRAAAVVLMPSVASIQDQPDRVGNAYLRAIGVIAMIAIPASGIFVIVAPELVRILLGDTWIPMILPFQVLVVTLLFRTSYKISDAVSQAMGSMFQRAWRQWVYAGLVTLGAYAGSSYGLVGVAAGVGLAVVLNFALMLDLVRRILGLDIWPIVLTHLRHLLAAIPLVAPVWLAAQYGRNAGWPDFGVLAFSGLAGVIALALCGTVLRTMYGTDGEWIAKLVSSRISERKQAGS